jgi:hypothetical protein
MSRQVGAAVDRGGEAAGVGRLAFIDHERQRYAEKVRLPNEAELLVGEYLDGGGTGPLGEFRIVLHDLGDSGGLLHPQLCLFGDGAAALDALLGLDEADLGTLLLPVAGHEALSRRLLALGVRDASDRVLEDA